MALNDSPEKIKYDLAGLYKCTLIIPSWQIESEFRGLCFLWRERKLENHEKNPQCKDRNHATTIFTKFVILGKFMRTFKSISGSLKCKDQNVQKI